MKRGCLETIPNRTFISKEEKTAPGFKVSKDRFTLLLCSNANLERLKALINVRCQFFGSPTKKLG
jgi:hypothetical protein